MKLAKGYIAQKCPECNRSFAVREAERLKPKYCGHCESAIRAAMGRDGYLRDQKKPPEG